MSYGNSHILVKKGMHKIFFYQFLLFTYYNDVTAILCKSFANKNCLHFSANKIVRKQMDANNANNFSKHIGIKVEIF